MRTLVVEDDALAAQSLSEMLDGLGYGPVSIASDLQEARLLVRSRGPFDLAFVDVYLGRAPDGVIIARELRAVGTPIVYASSHSDEATLAEALPVGAGGYLLKPFGQDQVFVAAETAIASAAVPAGGAKADEAVRIACEAIDRDPAGVVSTAELARVCAVSEATLVRAFKRQLNTTPHAYLMTVRLDRAADALLRTEEPVIDVARSCGFANQSHFARVFRERFGRTPGQHRYYGRRGDMA